MCGVLELFLHLIDGGGDLMQNLTHAEIGEHLSCESAAVPKDPRGLRAISLLPRPESLRIQASTRGAFPAPRLREPAGVPTSVSGT